MKTLYLVRHASAAHAPQDSKRPLSREGHEEARTLSRHMTHISLQPDIILCSSALRAQQTCHFITETHPSRIPLDVRDDLYLAPPEKILTLLQDLPDHYNSAMIVAHNPGLYMLTGELCSSHDLRMIPDIFSPGAVATLTSNSPHWSEIKYGHCILKDYTAVREVIY